MSEGRDSFYIDDICQEYVEMNIREGKERERVESNSSKDLNKKQSRETSRFEYLVLPVLESESAR